MRVCGRRARTSSARSGESIEVSVRWLDRRAPSASQRGYLVAGVLPSECLFAWLVTSISCTMRPDLLALVSLAAIFAMMLGEQALSRFNEKKLRHWGAVEPTGDVYRMMAW